ncbi:hypothetical protein HMPREF0322_01941 [Desulfitobacterium hafniense DP7]|uniref:Uncharacterized protein n=1 Tax=Desulfitobacterium hafniense DP7 TaxID=537010 RepID=G9XLV6_DESHA|nr:hypothetical protein HMPREF0322_01941 [Desulfitobacterium hafniense DP7]
MFKIHPLGSSFTKYQALKQRNLQKRYKGNSQTQYPYFGGFQAKIFLIWI